MAFDYTDPNAWKNVIHPSGKGLGKYNVTEEELRDMGILFGQGPTGFVDRETRQPLDPNKIPLPDRVKVPGVMDKLSGYASQAGEAVGNIWDRINDDIQRDPSKFIEAANRFGQSVFDEQNIGVEAGPVSSYVPNWGKSLKAAADVYNPESDYNIEKQAKLAQANPEQAAYQKAIENLMRTYQITEYQAVEMFKKMSEEDRALALEKARVDIEKSRSLITRRQHLNKLTDAQTIETLADAKLTEAKTRLENAKTDGERIQIAKEMVLIEIQKEKLEEARVNNLSESGKKLREFTDQVLNQPSIYDTDAKVQAEVERRFGEWVNNQALAAQIDIDSKAQDLINKILKNEKLGVDIKLTQKEIDELQMKIDNGGTLTTKQKDAMSKADSLIAMAGDRITQKDAIALASLYGETATGKDTLARLGQLLRDNPTMTVSDALKQAANEANYTGKMWEARDGKLVEMKDADAAREVDKKKQITLNDINLGDFSDQRTYVNETLGKLHQRVGTYGQALETLQKIPEEAWSLQKPLREAFGEMKSFATGKRPDWMGYVDRLEKLTTAMTFDFIAQTKGAITEKEMELFKAAVVSWQGTRASNMEYVQYLIQKANNKINYLNRMGAILAEEGRDKPLTSVELENLRKSSPDYGLVPKTWLDFTKGNADVKVDTGDTGNTGTISSGEATNNDSKNRPGNIPQSMLDIYNADPSPDAYEFLKESFPYATNYPKNPSNRGG